MPRKKIVIRIKYNPRESSNVAVPKNEINDHSEWDVKRILAALIVLLSIAGVLMYFLSSSAKTVHEVQGAVAIAQKSAKPESPDEAMRPPSSDALDQAQKHIPNDGTTRNIQGLKKSVSRQGKPVPLQNVARDGKKRIGNLNIARARFTSGIKRKEPVDNLASPFFALRDEAYSIYFFTTTLLWKETGLSESIVYELVPAFILAFTMVWVVSRITRKAGPLGKPSRLSVNS